MVNYYTETLDRTLDLILPWITPERKKKTFLAHPPAPYKCPPSPPNPLLSSPWNLHHCCGGALGCDDSQSACPPGAPRLPRAVFTVAQEHGNTPHKEGAWQEGYFRPWYNMVRLSSVQRGLANQRMARGTPAWLTPWRGAGAFKLRSTNVDFVEVSYVSFVIGGLIMPAAQQQ